jgi:hypothetical protein
VRPGWIIANNKSLGVGWAGHSPVHCRANSPISASASGANGLPSAHLGEENRKCGDLSASIGAFPPGCGDSSATIGAFPPTCGDSCATIAVLPFFCAGNSSQTPFLSLLAGVVPAFYGQVRGSGASQGGRHTLAASTSKTPKRPTPTSNRPPRARRTTAARET